MVSREFFSSTLFLVFLFLATTSCLASSLEVSETEQDSLLDFITDDGAEDSAALKTREKRAAKRCGPDITDWLIRQMNTNRNHRDIRHCRTSGILGSVKCLRNFANLVGNCRPWDFKCTQSFSRGGCPRQCPRTVTLCGKCVNYDVPGNIHYGWVGRAADISRWLLLYAADRVQKGGVDDPKDQIAITIGMDLWDKRKRLCQEVRRKIRSLNVQGTSGCSICTTRY